MSLLCLNFHHVSSFWLHTISNYISVYIPLSYLLLSLCHIVYFYPILTCALPSIAPYTISYFSPYTIAYFLPYYISSLTIYPNCLLLYSLSSPTTHATSFVNRFFLYTIRLHSVPSYPTTHTIHSQPLFSLCHNILSHLIPLHSIQLTPVHSTLLDTQETKSIPFPFPFLLHPSSFTFLSVYHIPTESQWIFSLIKSMHNPQLIRWLVKSIWDAQLATRTHCTPCAHPVHTLCRPLKWLGNPIRTAITTSWQLTCIAAAAAARLTNVYICRFAPAPLCVPLCAPVCHCMCVCVCGHIYVLLHPCNELFYQINANKLRCSNDYKTYPGGIVPYPYPDWGTRSGLLYK